MTGRRQQPALAHALVDGAHRVTAAEAAALGPRTVDKRRWEHAAGRCAARRALRRFGMVGMVGMNVDADVDVVRVASGPHLGAPLVVDKRGEPVTPAVYVSITHHEGLAVAAAHDAPVGIDLTRVEALDAAFNREAFCDGELASFCAYGAACVAVAFAAKEACAKLLGVGFALPLLGFSVRPDGARRGLLDVVHGAEGCPPGARRVHLRVHRFGGREINRGDRVLVVAASYTERP